MTTKTKGRNGGDRPTPKTSDNRNPTGIAPLAGWPKAAPVRQAASQASSIIRATLMPSARRWGRVKALSLVLADWRIITPNLADRIVRPQEFFNVDASREIDRMTVEIERVREELAEVRKGCARLRHG